MAPRPSAGPVSSVKVVTVTLVSSSSSATSGVQISGNAPSSSSSIPIGQVVGGFAGGVAIAVILVLIWKYWGRVIKRTERRRLKEAQDILTVRENTRRNAASGYNPQSEYRPMFTLNPDSRRVTFLARTPTPANQQTDASLTELASPAAADESMREKSPSAVLEEIPSTSSSATAPLLVTHEIRESSQPREEKMKLVGYRRPPSPTPTPLRTRAHMSPRDYPIPVTQQALSPLPPPPLPPKSSPSPEHDISSLDIRTQSPTPAILPLKPRPRLSPPPRGGSLSPLQASTSAPTPSSSRTTLPLVILPLPAIITTAASALPSPASSEPSPSPSESPSSTSSLPSPEQVLSTPAAPLPTASTWVRSPLRNSVLPSPADRPVIMPRAKNASVPLPPPPPAPPEFLSTDPVSLRPSVPSVASTASQYSTASGEPRVRRGFFDSFARRHKSVVGTIASSKRRTSTLSSVSVYSNNDD